MPTVVSHNPVKHFVPDDDDHRDWQPDPPVRDQSLTHARLAANLNQEPGSGDEQNEEPNDSHNRCDGHGSKGFPKTTRFDNRPRIGKRRRGTVRNPDSLSGRANGLKLRSRPRERSTSHG